MQRTADTVRALPANTLVWPGHEYAASNLQFALTVEPTNTAAQARLAKVLSDGYLVPTTVEDERATNPFLRAHLATVADAIAPDARRGSSSATATETVVLQALRDRKNAFKPSKR